MSLSSSKKKVCNPASMQAGSDLYHLSQAIRVKDTIWVSGQVGADGSMTVAKGVEAQSRLAFQNLKAVLESAGATLADIVDLVVLYKDIGPEVETFLKVKDEFIKPPYPAVTGIGVSHLAMPELLIEIRAIAVAGCGHT